MSIQKGIRDIIEATKVAEDDVKYTIKSRIDLMDDLQLEAFIKKLQSDMKEAAANLQFERAAELRDKINELKGKMK
jgi:excinuclease ABC subunit B